MKTYPIKFEGIYKERIWGGQLLAEIFNKSLPQGVKIGESWELADLPEDKSVIASGELAGMNIHQVLEKYPQEIMGDAQFKGNFPLLIKILDAQDVLSVQVHPDKDTCKRTGKGDPKDECWYIIKAQPGASIYKGLKDGVTKEHFAKAIEDGSVADLLVKIEVQPGECHMLPSGTAHAIGAGLLIAEIQLPSDTTYRVFDWNRVDDKGNPRQLHVEDALESIHFRQDASTLPVGTVGRIIDCDFFTVDKGHQAAGNECLIAAGGMKIIMIMDGSGEFAMADLEDVSYSAGDTILMPASCETVMHFSQDTEYLTIMAV